MFSLRRVDVLNICFKYSLWKHSPPNTKKLFFHYFKITFLNILHNKWSVEPLMFLIYNWNYCLDKLRILNNSSNILNLILIFTFTPGVHFLILPPGGSTRQDTRSAEYESKNKFFFELWEKFKTFLLPFFLINNLLRCGVKVASFLMKKVLMIFFFLGATVSFLPTFGS